MYRFSILIFRHLLYSLESNPITLGISQGVKKRNLKKKLEAIISHKVRR